MIIANNGHHGIDVACYKEGIEEALLNEFQAFAMVFMLGHLKPVFKRLDLVVK